MRSNTPNRSSNPRKSAVLALLTALLCACSAEDQNTGQSTIELPLPSVIRQVAALEGADLFLEIIINNNEPFINNSNQGTSNAWRVSIDVPVSQRNTITIRWIEMIEQKPVVLAQQIKSFDTGTSSSVVNLDDNYQTSGKGFDHDSDGISNLTERQNSTNPLVADSGQFVVNEPITVNISGGAYRIGSPASEAGRDASETQRDVFVEDFSLGKYEVTFEEYDQFATVTNRSKPDDYGWGRGLMPVMNVSWNDATAYAAWLSSETGKNYRLPTEAEWEYAARAGTNTAFHTGERITREQANYNGSISYSGSPAQTRATRTAAVGLYPANAFGLHDMHGNVNEFTCSTYSGSYDGAESTCNQFGDNRDYVWRGGGWSSAPADIRSAARSRDKPDRKYFYLGFRIAIGDAP